MLRLPYRRAGLLATLIALATAFGGMPIDDAEVRRSKSSPESGLRRVRMPRLKLAASNFVPVPSTIDSDGGADVTQPLQTFLNSVPNGYVVRFRPGGRYRVEGTLKLVNRTLTIEAQAATVFATQQGAGNRSQWLIRGGSRIIIRNMKVRGANPNGGTSEGAYVPALEHQHGFRIEGTQGVELDRVEVTDTYGDFVYLTRDQEPGNPANNVWIHDSTFRRNGRQGITAVNARNVIIERNTIEQTRRATIDLEPGESSFVVSNVFVLNNTVGVGRLMFVASHGLGTVNNVMIYGNQLVGHDMTIDVLPPGTQRRSNWVVANNSSNTTANNRQMRFFNIDGLAITNNTQAISHAQSAVILTDSCGIHVNNNELGNGIIEQRGPVCVAPFTMPKAPSIPGRS